MDFSLMRLLCFVGAGKCIIHGALFEFFSVCYVLVSYDYDAFFFLIGIFTEYPYLYALVIPRDCDSYEDFVKRIAENERALLKDIL